MKIGLNLLYLLPGQVGGSETYATELIKGYDRCAPDDEFVVFLNQEAADFPLPSSSRFTRVVCGVMATNRIKRYLYEQFILPLLSTRHRLDVLHSLGYVGPILHGQKHLISILDANFIRLSAIMSPLKRWVYSRVARLCARTCTHILTISSFSKDELIECLPVPDEKVTVVHLGVPSVLDGPPQESQPSRPEFLGIDPYIMVLGGGSPHKNIRPFVQAFERVCSRIPHRLIIAGRLAESLEDLPEAMELIRANRIVVTGFLEASDLDATYRGADLFVFPTLYEGFGLPVLEAQARGVPVLCSKIASVPEIGGDAVAYFDPHSIQGMGEAVEAILSDPEQLATLREKGFHNLKRFSWDSTCLQTLELYRALGAPRKAATGF